MVDKKGCVLSGEGVQQQHKIIIYVLVAVRAFDGLFFCAVFFEQYVFNLVEGFAFGLKIFSGYVNPALTYRDRPFNLLLAAGQGGQSVDVFKGVVIFFFAFFGRQFALALGAKFVLSAPVNVSVTLVDFAKKLFVL